MPLGEVPCRDCPRSFRPSPPHAIRCPTCSTRFEKRTASLLERIRETSPEEREAIRREVNEEIRTDRTYAELLGRLGYFRTMVPTLPEPSYEANERLLAEIRGRALASSPRSAQTRAAAVVVDIRDRLKARRSPSSPRREP